MAIGALHISFRQAAAAWVLCILRLWFLMAYVKGPHCANEVLHHHAITQYDPPSFIFGTAPGMMGNGECLSILSFYH